MKYLACDEELPDLEAALEAAAGAARLHALLALAWHLRQRDSRRALALLAELKRRLSRSPVAADGASRILLRVALIECEIAALRCQLDESQACLDAARALFDPQGDALAAGDACLAEACLAKALGQRDRELLALERALVFFDEGVDAQRIGLTQGLLRCERGVTQIRPARAGEPLVEPQSAHDHQSGMAQFDAATQAAHAAAQAYALCMRKPAEAAALFVRAAQLARTMGMVRLYCILSMNASNCMLELGDLEQASQCFEDAAERARQTDWPLLMGMTQTQVGRVLRLLGRGDESLLVLNQALLQLRVAPAGLATAFACSELAFTLLEVQRPLDSIEVMKEAIRLYRLWGSNVNLALTSARQARALATVGRIDEALAAIEEAQALVARHDYAALTVDINEALAEVHRRSKQPAPPGMTAPTATIHYAQCALDQGMDIKGWKPAPALLDYLADAWADADHMAQAYSYSRMARLADQQDRALKLNDPRSMLQLLGYHRLGAATGTAQALPELAAPAEPMLRPGAELLSAKEQAVLQLLARNYSNKEIAQSLGVSAETIKWRLKGLFSKLEAGSRKHAVVRARTLGMLSAHV